MKLFDDDPSLTWLFCLTHPDDEISIAAFIRQLARSGAKVYLSWTHHIPVREAEARAAAKKLGVAEENLFFHGATDGSVCDELPALLPRFQKMVAEVKPDRVVCGAFEQGHLDHDSTHWLVTHSFVGPVLEVPFYHVYTSRLQVLNRFSDPSRQEIQTLNQEDQRFKVEFAKGYPSQNIWSILFLYEVGHYILGRPARLRETERMRCWNGADYRTPAHPLGISRRVVKDPQWQRWLDAVSRAERAAREADHPDQAR